MKRVYVASALVALVGMGVLTIQLAIDPSRALFAVLAAFGFGVTIAVAALILIMVTHVARASWFVALRRPASAIASTLPLYMLLFIPIALNLRALYPWTHPADFPEDVRKVLEHQRWLLSAPFFIVRAYAYMAIWSALAIVLQHFSVKQDASPKWIYTAIQRRISGAALPLMAITLTLAVFDWFVALVPAFGADIFGMYAFSAGLYGAMGALAIACALVYRAGLFPSAVGPAHFLAIGRVMLTATMLWAYFGFFMLLLIWIGDLPHEVVFYVQRTNEAWAFFAGVQIFGHVGLAFLVLLVRRIKLAPSALAWVGVLLVLMHGNDMYWVVVPSGGLPSVLDCGAFLAVAGVAFAYGAWRFSRHAAVPVSDPYLPRALAYESP